VVMVNFFVLSVFLVTTSVPHQ